jgi:predicted exporter
MPPTVPTLRNTAEGLSGVKWIDNVAEISSILARYRRYSTAALVASYLGIYLFLYPRYRNRAWRLLVPTALGSLITIALLGIAGTKLQIFHVMALMLLLGIGVDYSIFVEGTAKDDGGPWLAVSISAISTLLSFGLLSLSATPALHAFGLVMLIGTTIVWLSVPLFVSPGGRQYNPVETGELKWGT